MTSIKQILPCLSIFFFGFSTSASEIEYRTLDGSGNHRGYPNLGQAGAFLIRKGENHTADTATLENAPNARAISNLVFSQSVSYPDPRNLSEMVWVWGQFVDHDIDHTLLQNESENPEEQLSIDIPQNDPVFSPGTAIHVDRSQHRETENGREQVNNISAWLDAGLIYGGRASEEDGGIARAQWLRTLEDGKLKTTPDERGDLLPLRGNDPDVPGMAMDARMGAETFIAGDVRANEHVALTSLHTLFVREHNRLAEMIDQTHEDLPIDPAARDEEVYQRARKIVGAEIQAITYQEFLPAMGVHLDAYEGYDPSIDPSATNEFATIGFRMGHTQVTERTLRLNEDGTPFEHGHLTLAEGFFRPHPVLREGGLDPILRGLAASVQEGTDTLMVDSLRNALFRRGANDVAANGTDLAALNILRGREHGLGNYNSVRLAYGMPPIGDFGEMTSDPNIELALSRAYGQVDLIDPWVGMLAEDRVEGSSLGALNIEILKDQFERLRDGDRFWFEIDPALQTWRSPETRGETVLHWLSQLRLSNIILLNTEIQSIQENVFFAEAR